MAVWRPNERIVAAFLTVATQWTAAGMSGAVTGLNYAGVRAGLEMAGIRVTPALFDGLRTMEAAALAVFRQQRETRG